MPEPILWAAIRIAELWATNRNSTSKSAILRNLKIICGPSLMIRNNSNSIVYLLLEREPI
ncbi:hypothetical protein RhiirA5_439083 [Rhizophagus irregularis]|uniref:Uncharacterized protein n=1 Tax=Rhizophagus irregularis TaxID=588596 RepID=A0A2N0NIA8_9GLOM|nr:hypothetical protein RhiirA5_439083 [Rhizophagus irregularis]